MGEKKEDTKFVPSTKEERIKNKQSLVKTVKRTGKKTTIFGLDNIDSILGGTSHVLVVGIYTFFHQGDYFTSALLAVLCITTVLIKIRVPQGKITKALKTPVQEIKTRLQETAKTIIRG